MPRQSQLSHRDKLALTPLRAVEGVALSAFSISSSLMSAMQPRIYKISATRHPSNTRGGTGHPFGYTQIIIAAPPYISSACDHTRTINSHITTPAITV